MRSFRILFICCFWLSVIVKRLICVKLCRLCTEVHTRDQLILSRRDVYPSKTRSLPEVRRILGQCAWVNFKVWSIAGNWTITTTKTVSVFYKPWRTVVPSHWKIENHGGSRRCQLKKHKVSIGSLDWQNNRSTVSSRDFPIRPVISIMILVET